LENDEAGNDGPENDEPENENDEQEKDDWSRELERDERNGVWVSRVCHALASVLCFDIRLGPIPVLDPSLSLSDSLIPVRVPIRVDQSQCHGILDVESTDCGIVFFEVADVDLRTEPEAVWTRSRAAVGPLFYGAPSSRPIVGCRCRARHLLVDAFVGLGETDGDRPREWHNA